MPLNKLKPPSQYSMNFHSTLRQACAALGVAVELDRYTTAEEAKREMIRFRTFVRSAQAQNDTVLKRLLGGKVLRAAFRHEQYDFAVYVTAKENWEVVTRKALTSSGE